MPYLLSLYDFDIGGDCSPALHQTQCGACVVTKIVPRNDSSFRAFVFFVVKIFIFRGKNLPAT
jgi:hypothetical protein